CAAGCGERNGGRLPGEHDNDGNGVAAVEPGQRRKRAERAGGGGYAAANDRSTGKCAELDVSAGASKRGWGQLELTRYRGVQSLQPERHLDGKWSAAGTSSAARQWRGIRR